ncbi:MAG: lipoprotein insertase outer membrane protein LolB [Steroidobacteraceae bacterium]
MSLRSDRRRHRLFPGRLSASVLLGALCLAGCASLRPVPLVWPVEVLPDNWEARRAVLQSWQSFDLTGRIALASSEQGVVAGLRWQQQAGRTELGLEGPAGVGAQRWRFEAGREDELRSLEAVLGFALPVSSVRYWLLGVPDPALPADLQLAADAARLEALTQAGWQVRFLDYGPVSGTRFELPARIEIRREGWRARLIVTDWRAGTR